MQQSQHRRGRKTPVDLKEVVAHLRALGAQPATPETRREVESYLYSKWEGIQAVAAQILGRWGDHDSVPALKDRFFQSFERKYGRSIQYQLGAALVRCVTAEDIDWLSELCIRSNNSELRDILKPGVGKLPRDVKIAQLSRFVNDPDPDARERAKSWLNALLGVDSRRPFWWLYNYA